MKPAWRLPQTRPARGRRRDHWGRGGRRDGLVALGATPLAPLGLVVVGAALGVGAMSLRHLLIRRWLRSQLRAVR
jgi:hypothetical protein